MKPRILVIRGGAIGDFILTLPAIKLLRDAFPGAHLELLGYQHIVALAAGRYYADATRSIEYGAMSGFFVPNGALAPDLVEYFSSFQQVISYLFDPDGFFEANLRRAGVKNVLPAFRVLDDSDHAAKQLAQPLEKLALFLEEAGAEVFPSPDDRQGAGTFFTGGAEDASWIAIHPGSGSSRKNWPIDAWADLGRTLAAHHPQTEIVLVGGEADEAQLDALMKAEAWRGVPVRVARNLPLPQLAAVLEQCAFFIGHDSGISHLAAAVGTPSLLLFGPTDPQVWAPANAHVHVLAAPEGDLSQLAVEVVWEKLRMLLH
jgi:heptosyltransferase-2